MRVNGKKRITLRTNNDFESGCSHRRLHGSSGLNMKQRWIGNNIQTFIRSFQLVPSVILQIQVVRNVQKC